MLDEARLGRIAGEFPDAADNETPVEKWNEVAATLVSRLPDLPAAALQQVRVHQGLFPLPNRVSLP
jgi:hypothetical protein